MFMAILVITPMANAQKKKKVMRNPDEAEYSIQGWYEKTKDYGVVHYRLRDPKSSDKVRFMYPEEGYVESNGKNSVGYIRFPFDSVETIPSNKEFAGLRYWYYDSIDKEWVTESEAVDTTGITVKVSQIEVMLVIDCSRSLDKDFPKVKNSAKNFIDQLYELANNNARLGLIAFNNSKKVIEPRTLDAQARNALKDSIDTWTLDNGTLLYRSMDAAIDIIQRDAMQNINADNFNGAYLIAFTDGLDNISTDDSRNLLTADDYYKYLQTRTIGKDRPVIHGKRLEPWVVSVRGIDITSESRAARVRDQFTNLVPHEHHKYLSNIRELDAAFRDICEKLVTYKTTLNCHVPEGVTGRVGWTLDEIIEEKPAPKPLKETRTPWFGVALEGGYLFNLPKSENYRSYCLAGVNVDMAFSVDKKFAIGARIGLFCHNEGELKNKYYNNEGKLIKEYKHNQGFSFLAGPEFKITFPQDNALLISAGAGMLWYEAGGYLSVGYKTKLPLYFMVEGFGCVEGIGVGAGVGWSFGGKPTKK
jgi:hypothetical protein